MFTLKFTRIVSMLCGLAFALQSTTLVSFAQQKRLLQVDDLFNVKQIVELQMSPSGNEVLFVQQEMSLKENRFVKTIWRLSTKGNAQPVRLTDNDKDYSPRWSPDGNKIAFLSTRSGTAQIWLLETTTGKSEKITDSQTGVLSFKWSPNGQYLAYTSQEEGQKSYDIAIQNKDKGVVIDKETFVVYQLLGNRLFLDLEKNSNLFLLNLSSRQTRQSSDVKHVEEFVWSGDSRALALTIKPGRGNNWSSDVAIYSIETGRFDIILRGEQGDSWDNRSSYSAPAWSPDGEQLAVLYRNSRVRWSSVAQIGVYSFRKGKLALITDADKFEPYLPEFYWSETDKIYFEHTLRGTRRLIALSPSTGEVKPVISSGACDDQFTYSRDNQNVAYVHQSPQEPPEIYIAKFPFTQRQKLTSLNDGFDRIKLPETERVKWTAPDGVQVEGTLFKPINYTNRQSYPLLVFVHGGPTIPIENRFELYSLGSSWIWPYPFRIFANRGYAVFLPDYRGTASYGKRFRETRDILKDSTADIVSGIESLIRKGVADRNQLGILGQSHGLWLASYLLAHNRIFKAASLAEGSANMMTNYAQMPGWLNLNIHEYYLNGSPYDNPQRYIELSPVFSLKGLTTATLLEFGEQNLAVQGLDLQTALWRQGVPHELLIYPKTGHNLRSPVLMLESINRNLDWFDYWMLGKKDQDPSRQEQYARWESMKKKMDQMRTRKSSTQAPMSRGATVSNPD